MNDRIITQDILEIEGDLCLGEGILQSAGTRYGATDTGHQTEIIQKVQVAF